MNKKDKDPYNTRRALVLGIVALALALVFNEKVKAEPVATTQPIERGIERKPVNLNPEAPANCIDDCIDWSRYPKAREPKKVCRIVTTKPSRKVIKRGGLVIVISTIKSKRVCYPRKVIV